MLTLSQLMHVTGMKPSMQTEHAVLLGLGLSLMAEHPELATRSFGSHYVLLKRAIELNQIRVYFDRFARFCGYAWWVHVPPAQESRLLKQGMGALEVDALSMEGAPWMLDLRASLGALPAILLDLRDLISPCSDSLTYIRYKRGRRLAKRVTRESSASFFRRPRPESASGEVVWLRSDRAKSALASARSALDKWATSGRALEVLAYADRYTLMPLPSVMGRIRYALEFRQAEVLLRPDGEPQAFYSWAWRETEEHAQTNARPLHMWEPGEWRDGRDPWLCDAVARPGGGSALCGALARFAYGSGGFHITDPSYGVQRTVSANEWSALNEHGDSVGDLIARVVSVREGIACPR